MKRTDIHRPGAIVPSSYTYLVSYALPGTDDPGFNAEYARNAANFINTAAGQVFGGLGKCGVCGACFRYGDLFRHETGDVIHMGQECAAKYEFLADRGDFDAQVESLKRGRRAHHQAIVNAAKREKFLAQHAGLAEALEIDNHIARDLKSSFHRWCSLSEKQIALALRLQDQQATYEQNKAAREAEKKVSAPIGRHTFRGVIVSIKCHSSAYGETMKMTVKMTTQEGVWMAWGTMPSSLDAKVGDEIELTGTLVAGNESHFAFFKRPTNATKTNSVTP